MSPRAERQRWLKADREVGARLAALRDEFWRGIDNDEDEEMMTDEVIYGPEEGP